jgi:acetyl-CoA C-acetyltransferase
MKNLPCIIGVAQYTWHPSHEDAPEPLEQWHTMARQAALDAGNENFIAHIDELDVVFSLSWNYDDAASQLAAKLGCTPKNKKLSGLSGTSPQKFINEAAEQILRGETQLALVVGGEALATKKKAKREDRKLSWPKPVNKTAMPFDEPFHPSEVAHQIFQAYLTFAMLDSARRHHLKLSLDKNREQEAEMMSRLSRVASQNPAAWFPKAHSTAELLDDDNANRPVAYPYNKLQMAFMDVDMAAAVLIASRQKADELGVPEEKRIYLHGWSYAQEPAAVAERPELWHSPAMEIAGEQALAMAGISINSLAHLDLYSCFPASLNFTRQALGISDNDTRPLTVTGGLPYFGGPGNNYTTHAVVAMVKRLRERRGDYGLVSGVGMHLTHHVMGIYSSEAPKQIPVPPDYTKAKNYVASIGQKIIENEVNGKGRIVAYSIIYGKDKNTAYAICDIDGGKRCYAICDNPETVSKMDKEEWVGKTVQIRSENKVNKF